MPQKFSKPNHNDGEDLDHNVFASSYGIHWFHDWQSHCQGNKNQLKKIFI